MWGDLVLLVEYFLKPAKSISRLDVNQLIFRYFIPFQGDLLSARNFSNVLPGRYVNAFRRRGTELRVCGLGLHGDEQRCFHRRRGRGRKPLTRFLYFPRSAGRLSSQLALRAKDNRRRRTEERKRGDRKGEGRDLRSRRLFPRDHLDCV